MSSHYIEFNIYIQGDKENLIDLSEKLNNINGKEISDKKELKFYLEKYIEENQKVSLLGGYDNFGIDINVRSIDDNGFNIDVPFESFSYEVISQLVMLNPNVKIYGGCSEILTTLSDDIHGFDFKSIIGDDKVKFKILNPEEDSHSYDDEIKEDTYSEGYYYTLEEFCDSMD